MSERRLKIFWIGEDHLLQVLQGRGLVSGVPEGAKVIRVAHDFERSAFGLMCEHESFPDVPEGCVVPWGEPLTFIAVPQSGNSMAADVLSKRVDWSPMLVKETTVVANPQATWRDRPSLL